MARIRVVPDRSDPEALAKVKRFTEVFEYFAATWAIRFVIDAPNGATIPPKDSAESTVFIHVFTKSIPGVKRCLHAAGTFALPRENGIQDPSGNTLAAFINSHLYIFFDIAQAQWPGDTLVLRHILAAALPKMLGEEARARSMARECLLRERFHTRAVARSSALLREAVFSLFRYPLEARTRYKREERVKATRVIKETSQNLVNLGFRANEIEGRLAQKEHAVREVDIGREFDALLSWQNIKGIRISDETLTIYTNPLTMEHLDGQTYLIGEYEIRIRPHSMSGLAHMPASPYHWVMASKWGWRGPYAHAAVANYMTTPSWGTATNMLQKALGQYDFMGAISVVLAYLTGESSPPHFAGEKGSPPEPTPFYQNDEEKTQERNRYAEFVTVYRKKLATASLRNELAELRESAKDEAWRLAEACGSFRDHTADLEFLLRCLAALPLEEELALFFKNPYLVDLEVHGEQLWAVYAPMFRKKDNTIVPSYALSFSPSARIEIVRIGSAQDDSALFVSEKAQRELFVRLAGFGMFGTALQALSAAVAGKAQAFWGADERLGAFLKGVA